MQKFREHLRKTDLIEPYRFAHVCNSLLTALMLFLRDLTLKTRTCKFRMLQDSIMCEQILFRVQDKKVREREKENISWCCENSYVQLIVQTIIINIMQWK